MDLFFSHFCFLWHQHSGAFIIYYFTYIFIYVWIEMILSIAFWQPTRCMEKVWRKNSVCFHKTFSLPNTLQQSWAAASQDSNHCPAHKCTTSKGEGRKNCLPFQEREKYLCININRGKWIYSNPCLQFMAKPKDKTDSWNQFFMDRRKGSSKNETENTFMIFF